MIYDLETVHGNQLKTPPLFIDPVSDDAGHLLGVVSTAGGVKGATREGEFAIPLHSLPVWIARELTDIVELTQAAT